MLDFYGIYLLGIVIISISALTTDFYLNKLQRRKEIIINVGASAFMFVCMLLLQEQEIEIYKEYFLAGQRLNCNGFALSKDLGYVLEGDYFLQTNSNKLISIASCEQIANEASYTYMIASAFLILYAFYLMGKYFYNQTKYKNNRQIGAEQ